LDRPYPRLWHDRSVPDSGFPSSRHLVDPSRLHSMCRCAWNLSRPSPARRRGGQLGQLSARDGLALWRVGKRAFRSTKKELVTRSADILVPPLASLYLCFDPGQWTTSPAK
jgi:hypothetical protein